MFLEKRFINGTFIILLLLFIVTFVVQKSLFARAGKIDQHHWSLFYGSYTFHNLYRHPIRHPDIVHSRYNLDSLETICTQIQYQSHSPGYRRRASPWLYFGCPVIRCVTVHYITGVLKYSTLSFISFFEASNCHYFKEVMCISSMSIWKCCNVLSIMEIFGCFKNENEPLYKTKIYSSIFWTQRPFSLRYCRYY